MSLLEAVRWDLLSPWDSDLAWAVILVYFVRKRLKLRPSGAHAELPHRLRSSTRRCSCRPSGSRPNRPCRAS